jgi:hypothetical protein
MSAFQQYGGALVLTDVLFLEEMVLKCMLCTTEHVPVPLEVVSSPASSAAPCVAARVMGLTKK